MVLADCAKYHELPFDRTLDPDIDPEAPDPDATLGGIVPAYVGSVRVVTMAKAMLAMRLLLYMTNTTSTYSWHRSLTSSLWQRHSLLVNILLEHRPPLGTQSWVICKRRQGLQSCTQILPQQHWHRFAEWFVSGRARHHIHKIKLALTAHGGTDIDTVEL
jgi:hypothetical protein